ncbi:MAG TPA: sulfite exporter TauE/SafE family protein [Castellaniella sp.]|uniref:sulfite exporter TauE/SafE family protein n=1 Tax=Castellaniella sp. TaxID=1955812 RepID=UPI002F1EC204
MTTTLLPFTDPWIYALMAALILGSAFLQGMGGVGFTMFAAPVALIVSPELVPGPLLTLGGMATLLTALRERQHIAWQPASFALGGRTVGALIAVLALSHLPRGALGLVFAGLILLAVILSASGLKFAVTRGNASVAGLVSGVMGTLTSVGSPPLAIIMQYSAPPSIRATIGAILACGATVSIGLLALSGHYGLRDVLLSVTLLPFLFCGFWLSNRARHRVSGPALRHGLLIFCAVSAIVLAVKTLWQWA